MKNLGTHTTILALGAIAVMSRPVDAQGPRIVATIDGEPMYQVLPAGAIPAIMRPEYLQGEEADAQMADDEPVMGLMLEGEVRAYSLWQLDAHEIVNDSIGGIDFAVTW